MARNFPKCVLGGWGGRGGRSVETGKILKINESLCIGIEWRNAVLRAFMYMFEEPKGLLWMMWNETEWLG